MKIYLTTHSDGTTSLSSAPNMIKKPNDTPVVEEYELSKEDAELILDNPDDYQIQQEGDSYIVVKK